MRIMSPDAIPRLKTIGILSGGAVVLFLVSAWLIAGGSDYEMYGFPSLLIGMVLLFLALVLLALRAINRRQNPTLPN